MSNDQLDPSNIRFPNDTVEPEGCNEPRVLSREVWRLNQQVGALCDAIAALCELQRKLTARVEEALTTIGNKAKVA